MSLIPFWFAKPPALQHKHCNKFDQTTGKCTRRDISVPRNEFACSDADTPQTYQKFRCMHNGCTWNSPKEMGIKTYPVDQYRVQVGFFKCEICGKITAVFQLGGQNVVPVDPEVEDVFDIEWLSKKISTAV